MRKTAIATSLILVGAIAVFVADMTKQGYFEFTSTQDIQKQIPKFTPPQFAKVLEGNDKGCLTKSTQTKPVTIAQIRTLRQLTDPNAIATLLGNPYCETDKGFKWMLESGKTLNLKLNETLYYDFITDTAQSLTSLALGRQRLKCTKFSYNSNRRESPISWRCVEIRPVDHEHHGFPRKADSIMRMN